MQFTFHVTDTLIPLALAAAHGTTDFELGLRRLWPYAAAAVFPAPWTTPFFLTASALHFSHDVGHFGSVALHASWMFGAVTGYADVMVDCFAAFFCLVHTPLHYRRHMHQLRFPLGATVLLAVAIASTSLPDTITVTEPMQQLIIAHVVCDELNRTRGSD